MSSLFFAFAMGRSIKIPSAYLKKKELAVATYRAPNERFDKGRKFTYQVNRRPRKTDLIAQLLGAVAVSRIHG